jgi:hypothetical protein
VSGWTEINYTEFNTSNIYQLLDGGMDRYVSGGIVDGIRQMIQKIIGTDTLKAFLYAENFSNTAKAQNIYNTVSSTDIIDSVFLEYPTSIVVGSNNPIGQEVVIYAHFNRFYFELKFVGYGSIPVNAILDEAKRFLTVYQTKIKS